MFKLILVSAIFLVLALRASCSELSNLYFPKSFKFGAATAAYQVEGGWNASRKGLSNWDVITHTTSWIADGSTGDVACDSYHKYREDIQLLRDLGVDHYRFSISWPRILPTGFIYEVNQNGVDYYNNLINGLLEAGIEPWVRSSLGTSNNYKRFNSIQSPTDDLITMFHFDTPQSLEHLGGWSNSEIVEYFTDLADLLFSLYGDRVKLWMTINEPYTYCVAIPSGIEVYDTTIPAGTIEYLCSYNVLKAHASVYRLYDRKYRKQQGGRISLTLPLQFGIPGNSSSADTEAAERYNQFSFGLYAHPLIYGNYPTVVIDVVDKYSAIQGFKKSRLPKFTPEEINNIKGTVDFLAINHYSSYYVKLNNSVVDKNPSTTNDMGIITYVDPSWVTAASTWLQVYPEGFRLMLKWVQRTYNNPEIIITEQGFSDLGQLNDTERIIYYQSYLSEALKAIYEDKVRLTGYTAWSLIDDFEWLSGYTVKFGLYHVDFDSPNRTRTPKESSYVYRNIIKTKCLVDQCE